MSGPEGYNRRSPAVKRILREAAELREPTYEYYAQPLEDNIFEWHFTVRGAEDTDFADGIYHGRIILPNDYPMKPPSIILLTPNGRFELNKKICLSISGYHPETWQPCWSIRTVLLAIIAFMPTKSDGAIGSLDYTAPEKKMLASRSHRWQCATCGSIEPHLKSEKSHPGFGSGGQKMDAAEEKKHQREDEAFRDFMSKVQFEGEKPQAESDNNNPAPASNNEPKNPEESNKKEPETENPNSSNGGPSQESTKKEEVIITNQPQSASSSSTTTNQDQQTTPPVIQEQQQVTPPPPPQQSLLHGPVGNALLVSIFAIIVALLARRLLLPYLA